MARGRPIGKSKPKKQKFNKKDNKKMIKEKEFPLILECECGNGIDAGADDFKGFCSECGQKISIEDYF